MSMEGARDALAPPLPAPLVGLTLEAALVFAGGGAGASVLPVRVAAYAEGVLRAMFLSKLKVVALLLVLAGLVAAGGAISRHALQAAPPGEAREQEKPGKKGAPAPAAARVVKPKPGGVARTTTQPGGVQAIDHTEVTPAVSGILNDLTVDIGSRVKKGQVLARIDAPLLGMAEREAAANLRQAKGVVREGQAKVTVARAKVHVAKSTFLQREAELVSAKADLALKDRQLKRIKEMHAQKSVDERLVDEKQVAVEAAKSLVASVVAALENAKAEVVVKEGEVSQAEAALVTATANVEAAEVLLEKARHIVGLTRVVAPFDGVVTRRNHRDGDYLQSNGGSGQLPILTLQRTDRLMLVVEVPERDVPLTEPGLAVDLAIDALADTPRSGYAVSRVGYALDPKNRTMRVEIDVPNPKEQLRPGMYGSVTIHLRKATPGAFRVPASSLAASPAADQAAVSVVSGGKARRTAVRVGNWGDEEVEILSGLKPSDLVVADAAGLSGEVVPVEAKEGSASNKAGQK
jgi:RND family efflux transporter MFP subunit